MSPSSEEKRVQRKAVFDATGRYRYWLWRGWDAGLPTLGFVMLNPHRADAAIEDPTIRRCLGFAKAWNYGSLEVVNLFAYCTAHPRDLKRVANPVGPDNDAYLLETGARVARLIVAWGNSGRLLDRDRAVLQQFADHSQLYCLGYTRSHQPRHPLYLRRDTRPQPVTWTD